MVKVLVVGGGGREHALAWAVGRSPDVQQVLVAPGNAGTAHERRTTNVDVSADDIPGLVELARSSGVDMTIIGPEAPLVAGVVDAFQDAGLRCFGPTAAAARLEGSKAFTKDFLARHCIPTAGYQTFSDIALAQRYIEQHGAPLVVKADGLAAGKGVVVAHSVEEATETARAMLCADRFGAAGKRVVVEDFLAGEEASFIAIVDGEHVLPLATSQDHKPRDDGDRGPNTGGMGAYSPAPVVTDEIHERVMREIIEPTVRGLAADGAPYTGFLYAGLMIADDGTPNVVEFNCRFGDPEAQPVMMRLRSDLVALCDAALSGSLDKVSAQWDPRSCLGVVLAAGGYPNTYQRGDAIAGLDREYPDTKVFHAGTKRRDGRIVTAGGRVLCVCAMGDSVSAAQAAAYERVASIEWRGVYYRTDIGSRAVARETAQTR